MPIRQSYGCPCRLLVASSKRASLASPDPNMKVQTLQSVGTMVAHAKELSKRISGSLVSITPAGTYLVFHSNSFQEDARNAPIFSRILQRHWFPSRNFWRRCPRFLEPVDIRYRQGAEAPRQGLRRILCSDGSNACLRNHRAHVQDRRDYHAKSGLDGANSLLEGSAGG